MLIRFVLGEEPDKCYRQHTAEEKAHFKKLFEGWTENPQQQTAPYATQRGMNEFPVAPRQPVVRQHTVVQRAVTGGGLSYEQASRLISDAMSKNNEYFAHQMTKQFNARFSEVRSEVSSLKPSANVNAHSAFNSGMTSPQGNFDSAGAMKRSEKVSGAEIEPSDTPTAPPMDGEADKSAPVAKARTAEHGNLGVARDTGVVRQKRTAAMTRAAQEIPSRAVSEEPQSDKSVNTDAAVVDESEGAPMAAPGAYKF